MRDATVTVTHTFFSSTILIYFEFKLHLLSVSTMSSSIPLDEDLYDGKFVFNGMFNSIDSDPSSRFIWGR